MSTPELPLPDTWTSRRAASYSEAGNLLRHYSTNRIAVLTLAIPVCIGILGWLLSASKQPRLTIYLLVAEGLIFSYALVLSVFFSTKYEQTRRCLVRLEAGEDISIYNSIAGTRLREGWTLDGVDKSFIVIGFVLHVVYYFYFFTR